MQKHFYSHLVKLDELLAELNNLDMDEREKLHLSMIMESTLHHIIIDEILSELHDDDKKIFLNHLGKNDHDTTWHFVRMTIFDAERKIITIIEQTKSDFREDMYSVKFENEHTE